MYNVYAEYMAMAPADSIISNIPNPNKNIFKISNTKSAIIALDNTGLILKISSSSDFKAYQYDTPNISPTPNTHDIKIPLPRFPINNKLLPIYYLTNLNSIYLELHIVISKYM